MQLREKVGKPQFTAMICGSRGSKSRLAEAAGAEPSGMRDEKLHAVVARSTFPSQNVQSTSVSEHFWKLRCRKSARRCGAKHISKSKCTKHTMLGQLLEVEMSKKCTPLWREAHFEVKSAKKHRARSTFGSCYVEKVHAVVVRSTFRGQNVTNTDIFGPLLDVQMSFCVAGARDWAPCQKWAKRESFVAFQKRWQAWDIWRGSGKMHFRVAGAVQETCSSELLGGQGADFLREVAFWSIKSSGFAEMILRDKCSTSYDLASLFRGRRKTLETWSGKIAKRIGTRPSALHSTFHFWRTSRRIASFLMLSSSKIEEVSQNCFVLDVVKFKNWGSLAELLRFEACQIDRQTNREIER